MAWLGKVLIQLEHTPYVGLMILPVLRVDGVELARGARRGKEWAVEERGETRQCSRQCSGRYAEEVVRVGRAGVSV